MRPTFTLHVGMYMVSVFTSRFEMVSVFIVAGQRS